MLGPSTELEDALQDVFLRLFRDLGSLREPRALRGFLQRITVHVAVSELRRRRAHGWLLLSNDGRLPDLPPPADDIAEPLRHLAISDVLERMSPESRLVFVLRHVEGFELTELASALGCSLATTKRRVAASERRVRQLAGAGEARVPKAFSDAGGERVTTT
jgi:RNA polymerase sigma-70 factor (ECF subfamily)